MSLASRRAPGDVGVGWFELLGERWARGGFGRSIESEVEVKTNPISLLQCVVIRDTS